MRRWMTRMSPVSSFSSRYLPRRSTPLILAPSSLAMNCFLVCRRMVRVPVTCAVFTRLPTTSRSSPRRIVSTSGSSGNARGLRLRRGLELEAQPLPGGARGGRFGLFLRAALARTSHVAADAHLREELLGVIGPFVADRVPRRFGEVPRHQLLQPRFVVLASGTLAGGHDPIAE